MNRTRTVERMTECPHVKAWSIKWGIAADKKWCGKCKTWVHATVDWSGHP